MPKKHLTAEKEDENDVSHITASVETPARRTRGQIAKEAKSTSVQDGDGNETGREPSMSSAATSIGEDADNPIDGDGQPLEEALPKASADGQSEEDVADPDMEAEQQSPTGSEDIQKSPQTQDSEPPSKHGELPEAEAQATQDEAANTDGEAAAPEDEQTEELVSISVPKKKRGRTPKARRGARMTKSTISGVEDRVDGEEPLQTEVNGSQPPAEGGPSQQTPKKRRGRSRKATRQVEEKPADDGDEGAVADGEQPDGRPQAEGEGDQPPANAAPSQKAPKKKRGRPRKFAPLVVEKSADGGAVDAAAHREQADGQLPTAGEENQPPADAAPSEQAPKRKRGRPRKSVPQVEERPVDGGEEDAAAGGEPADGQPQVEGEEDQLSADAVLSQEPPKRKRGRPPKAKMNKHNVTPGGNGDVAAVDGDQAALAEGAPSEQVPKRKRGRPRKSAPQVEEKAADDGGKDAAADGEQPEVQPQAEGEEDQAPADAALSEQAPKRKRGRPRKSAPQVEEKPVDGGEEDAAAAGEQPPTADEDGTPPADAAPSEQAQAPKKKRGRPRKSAPQVVADEPVENGEEAGDGAEEPTEDQPPAAEEVETEDQLAGDAGPSNPTPKRKRGRPPKVKPQVEAPQPATDEDDGGNEGDDEGADEDQPPVDDTERTESVLKKKRGRPAKALDGSGVSVAGTPGQRKRGRPRKHSLPAADAVDAPSSQMEAGTENPKGKRGKPASSGRTLSQTENDDGAAAADLETPKRKRGRPRKHPAPADAAADGDAPGQSDAGEAAPKRKPGRPPKNPHSQQQPKSEEKHSAKDASQILSFRPPARSNKRKSSRPRPSA